MPKRKNAHKHTRAEDKSQEGFIADKFRRTMNKNEKIIMGLLVGGIVTFLILSIVILFGRGGQSLNEITDQAEQGDVTPSIKVLKTPYPTIPPISDYTMQVNEARFYPENVNITAGHSVTILNIGNSDTTLTPTTQDNTYNFGTIESNGGEATVLFDKAGIYRYTRTGVDDQTLTITVR